ncbi:MAG TPA: methyltransferase domain-containing protein [Acidobacteriaceae bacterium]|nr:methyltransferase domain-containing protein [Acidobacteriaceae bacterium]
MSSDSERIIGLYQRHAAVWDRLRNPGNLLEKGWLDRFLALLPPRAAILDLGCGSGLPTAGYFLGQEHRVTGVDSSEPLLEMARARFPQQEWIVADMRTLDLGRRFDGILAWDSFFHLSPEDQTAMFSVFQRHAGPRAALMFTSGPEHGCVLGEFEGEPLYHGSLDLEEYRALLEGIGFEVAAHVVADPACGEHTIWLAQAR